MDYTSEYNVAPLIPLTEYIFHRLYQLNCRTIFGTPDHFTGAVSPYALKSNIRWIQTINQLNSSFVADAYARLMGISCYIASESSELGHINGFFGSFCEHVPILHLVILEQSHDLERLIGDVSIFHGILDDPFEIDQCLNKLYWGKRPVYLGLRARDIAKLIPCDGLNQDVKNQSIFGNLLEIESRMHITVSSLILNIGEKLYNSNSPLIIVDALVDRYGYSDIVQQFLEETQIPFATTPISKATIDETLPSFVGTFLGSMSQPIVREYMENCDCTLILGCLLDNFKNSYCKFTYKTRNQITLWNNRVSIDGNIIPDIPFHMIFQDLISSIDSTRFSTLAPIKLPNMIPRVAPQPITFLRQEYLWYKVSTWLQPGDIVISESGTSSIGLLQQKFPAHSKFVSQPVWNSSGYSIGACLGVLAALQDQKLLNQHRVILIVGDGSLQFTFQELGTILSNGFNPYMFIVNNQGYTVDRMLNKDKTHLNATYFDIQQWNFLDVPKIFSHNQYFKHKCITVGELDLLLEDQSFNKPDLFKIVELILPSTDLPIQLAKDFSEDIDDELSPPSKRLKV